jgi:hypothetical protein
MLAMLLVHRTEQSYEYVQGYVLRMNNGWSYEYGHVHLTYTMHLWQGEWLWAMMLRPCDQWLRELWVVWVGVNFFLKKFDS